MPFAAVEERVGTLEAVLGEFIVSTSRALSRMERGISDLKEEMRDFKEEMRDFKDEMKDFKEEMRDFKDEMKDFKEEMRDFKDEMKDFKEESVRDRKEMNRKWGDLANKMGTIVEDIAAPNIPGVAGTYFGIESFDFFAIRVKKRNIKKHSVQREFDAVAVSENEFIVVEVKSTPRQGYIDDFLAVLKELPDYFPEISEKKLIPIFTSLFLPENIVKYLSRNGIYAMGIKEETMEILNFDNIGAVQ